MTSHGLAMLNASLNATTLVLLLFAWRAIKVGRRVQRHRALVLACVAIGALFLTSYFTRIALFGDTHFRGEGILRPLYFGLLISHVGLAVIDLPLILVSLWFGWKQRFDKHRRIARIAMPVWVYVSATGPLVYLALELTGSYVR